MNATSPFSHIKIGIHRIGPTLVVHKTIPREAILDSLKNQIAQQSETQTKRDVQTPAEEAGLAKSPLFDAKTEEELLLHGQVSNFDKPRAITAPKYAVPSQGDNNQLHTASSHQQPPQENTPTANSPHARNGNSSSLASNGNVNVSATVKSSSTERETEGKKNQSMDFQLTCAMDEGDLMRARSLLNQGVKPAENVFQVDPHAPEQFINDLVHADDVQTFHALIASLPPEINAKFMDNMIYICLNQRKEKLLEYIARHSTISDVMIGFSADDQSNKSFQALLDGGIKPQESCIMYVSPNKKHRTAGERYASLPSEKSIAAQAFDAHRDRKFEKADNLFNLPAPTEENPLGLKENALKALSKQGLEFVYLRLQKNHAGLISTAPDGLLIDGFRSEIVGILRSCQKECKAAWEALTRQMGANGFTVAYKARNNEIRPCNAEQIQLSLFALQLSTHERLLQIVRPPLKEKDNSFQTLQSGITSFFRLDKNAEARTAQANKIIKLAEGVPELMLQLPQEILNIKTSVPEKRISMEIALQSIQKHQETLETQFEELMRGTSPGTDPSEQMIINMFGNTFKELAAIREATLRSDGLGQPQ